MKDWRVIPQPFSSTHWDTACGFEAKHTPDWDLRFQIAWKTASAMDQVVFRLEDRLREIGSKEDRPRE